jgi:hypothetical protein
VGLLANPHYLVAQGIGLAIMFAISYTPPLQAVFNTAPLSATDWLLAVAVGALVLLADEIRKTVQHQRDRHKETVS